MSRLEHILEELKSRGHTFSSLKQLGGGINSAVFQAKSDFETHYALKLYSLPTENDVRNRCLTEKNFLDYLSSCKINKTPKLHESNVSEGWCLLSWIEGQRPNSLQPIDLQEIALFISSINDASTFITRSQLQPASDACHSLSGLVASIDRRIKRLLSTTSRSEVSINAVDWIVNTVKPRFQSLSNYLINSRASCSHWHHLNSCRIASPSDVGIHNTLRTQQGLHFIDFEYAGLDDLSKLAADWILQPEYCMSQQEEDFFIRLLFTHTKEAINGSWVSRLSDIKPLIHIKWCLIMLNQVQNGNLTKAQLEKTISYFSQL